jgi:hypothetical protein
MSAWRLTTQGNCCQEFEIQVMQQKLLDSKLTQELSEVKLMLQNLPISLQNSSSGVYRDGGLLRSGVRPVWG